jgi:DNA-binding transcriptional LysR family regulator
MDVRQLRYVVAVARTKHFTHAAEQLGVAQPALSQAISLLEKRMAVALFDRSSRRVELTAAGRLFVERAERILADLDSLKLNMFEHAELLRGQVNVGSMVFFFFGIMPLADIVTDFIKIYPGVELSLDNNSVNDSLDALRLGKIDVALLNITENTAYPDLDFTVIGHDDIVAALPPDHRLADRSLIRFSELCDELFIVYKPGSTMRNALNTLSRSAGFAPRAAAHSRNIILVRSLVSAGAGISIGPKSYLMSPGPPVAVVPIEPAHKIALTMVTRPNVDANPAAKAFVAFVRERFAQMPKLFELSAS